MNTTKRLSSAAASVITVAVLGVGAMTPAAAAQAGVADQSLRVLGTTPARVTSQVGPSALPTASSEQLRYAVGPDGGVRRIA